MKKILILIISLLPIISYAQLFEGAIIGGMTASQIDGDGQGGYHKIGFSTDIIAKLNINKKWKIISGVGIVTKGARSPFKYSYDIKKLSYAEIPIWTEYIFSKKFSFYFGLNYGYLINGYEETTYARFNAQDLNLLKHEISTFFSANLKISNNLSILISHNYSILPINKYNNVLTKNIFIYYILYNQQLHPLWWNNSLRLSLQYKIFSIKK
jgi:hypothetical protein